MTSSTVPKTTTGAVFNATPGMPGFFKSNFDFQLARAISQAGGYGDGGAAGECFSTARRVPDGDTKSWETEWGNTAERIERIGYNCLNGGHIVSAREAFLRASVYWRTSSFYIQIDDAEHRVDVYERARSCFRQAAKLFDPPIEPVSFPYENGKTLPGYFMHADGADGPRPTVMIMGGGDTVLEEHYFHGGAAAVRRGYNAFLWEGPGQQGVFTLDRELTFRPDWEVPTRYAVDYVLSRPEVDGDKLALMGVSLGGYLAPRAVAYEKRISALVANCLLPDLQSLIMAILSLDPEEPYGSDIGDKIDLTEPMKKHIVTNFTARLGIPGQSPAALLDILGNYNLDGLESEITCHVLDVRSEGEGPLFNKMASEFFDKLTCPKTDRAVLAIDGGEAHCQINNPSLKNQIELDWIDDIFKES
jgi:pimeloyl-ACP methyl ester carboxylesterase